MPATGTDQHPVDTEYYEILQVEATASAADIKKSYRKLALVHHPDKPGGSEETFQRIGEAYQILSDPERRSTYNKYGKKSAQPEGGLQSVGQLFNQIFGGDKFLDLIGEISIGKDIMGQMEVVMTDEEKEALEKEAKEADEGVTPDPNKASASTASPGAGQTSPGSSNMADLAQASEKLNLDKSAGTTQSSATNNQLADKDAHKTTKAESSVSSSANAGAGKSMKNPSAKLSAEQKQKLDVLQKKQAVERHKRIRVLADKLEELIKPYTDALAEGDTLLEGTTQGSSTEEKLRKKGFTFKPRVKPAPKGPGAFSSATEKSNESIQHWLKKTKKEVEELKMESFGVELLHLIGSIYHLKGSGYVKSAKASPLFLGLPSFWRGVKDTSRQIKELAGFVGNARDMQRVVATMEQRQKAGNMTPEEKQALEKDISEKMLVIAWRATRLELNGILREVVDIVIHGDPDPNPPPEPAEGKEEDKSAAPAKEKLQPVRVPSELAFHRAEAIDLLGGIFRQVEPEAGDEEARHIERIVAEQMDGGKAASKAREGSKTV